MNREQIVGRVDLTCDACATCIYGDKCATNKFNPKFEADLDWVYCSSYKKLKQKLAEEGLI